MANHYSNIDTNHSSGNSDPESFHYALTSADSANPEVSRKYNTSLRELWDKFQKKEDIKTKQKLFKLLIIRFSVAHFPEKNQENQKKPGKTKKINFGGI